MFIIGTNLGDKLAGTGQSDAIYGLNGNDSIQGFGGSDLIHGGAGMDLVSYLGSSLGVNVNLATNQALGGDAAGDVLYEIENLGGSTHNDALTGNAFSNRLFGDAGDDVLTGGAGADFLSGGSGTDTASYLLSASSVKVDLSLDKASGGEAAGDTFLFIENLSGSSFGDILIGNSLANVLKGGNGDDELYGLGGDDQLEGGNGVDHLIGGIGDDFLIGGAGADILDGQSGLDYALYGASASGVTVNLATGVGKGGDAEGDTLVDIEVVGGSDFGDILTGTSSTAHLYGYAGNDKIYGGAGASFILGYSGNDTLKGAGGSDLLDGGSGSDFFDYNKKSDSLANFDHRDVIGDFTQSDHDQIRFIGIDGKESVSGTNSLSFIGTGGFTAEGQVRYQYSGDDTLLQVNTAGKTGADMEILLNGHLTLHAGDFVFS